MATARSMISIGVTHTGQPGPWIKAISARQHFIQPEADEGMGLAAANLHDVPRPRRGGMDGRGQAMDGVGVAVFVEVFQGVSVRGQGSGIRASGLRTSDSFVLRHSCFVILSKSPISSRSRNVSWASASSMRLMAKPTWTST